MMLIPETQDSLRSDCIHQTLVQPQVCPPLHREELHSLTWLFLIFREAFCQDMWDVVSEQWRISSDSVLIHDSAHSMNLTEKSIIPVTRLSPSLLLIEILTTKTIWFTSGSLSAALHSSLYPRNILYPEKVLRIRSCLMRYMSSRTTCRLLDPHSLHKATIYFWSSVLEMHVCLLRTHPLHPIFPGKGHCVLNLNTVICHNPSPKSKSKVQS